MLCETVDGALRPVKPQTIRCPASWASLSPPSASRCASPDAGGAATSTQRSKTSPAGKALAITAHHNRAQRPARFLACLAMEPLISFDEALALGDLDTHEEIGELVERAWAV